MRPGGSSPIGDRPSLFTGIGIALLVAAVLGITGLVSSSDEVLRSVVRLDDHETSFPDHLPVQEEGADQLRQLDTDDVLTVTVQEDRSTIEITAPLEVGTDRVDDIVERMVATDAGTDPNQLADARTQLDTLVAQLGSIESSAASAADAESVANAVLLQRAAVAELAAAEAARSRFVVLSTAAPAGSNSSAAQWIGLILLGAVGAALLTFGAKDGRR